ncbi:glyoxalase superfamily protein [Gordonia spumicola]|nr:glyoxalase superfamily protein [Gordonia spumicola]
MSQIVLTGRLTCATADQADRVREHLPRHAALTRAEPGCVSFHVEPTDDPLVWLVSERFADRAGFDAHQARVADSDWARATDGVDRDYRVEEAGSDVPDVGPPIPVVRMFDEASARDFYIDYLRFRVEWEHRFEPGTPLYMRIRRGDAVIDLSEHHGDGTPGTVVWIPIRDAAEFHAELVERPHPKLRPGIDVDSPGGPTIVVIDPSGNVLRFCQPT